MLFCNVELKQQKSTKFFSKIVEIQCQSLQNLRLRSPAHPKFSAFFGGTFPEKHRYMKSKTFDDTRVVKHQLMAKWMLH
jgi:hypothetical protein